MRMRHFAPPFADKERQEHGGVFSPQFDANGLLSAVVTDAASGGLLMLAHMNVQALGLSIETGIAHFWSCSRNCLWKKGEKSGNILHIMEIRTDCDQDALWLKVRPDGRGVACHTGARSCFYRKLEMDQGILRLVIDSQLS